MGFCRIWDGHRGCARFPPKHLLEEMPGKSRGVQGIASPCGGKQRLTPVLPSPVRSLYQIGCAWRSLQGSRRPPPRRAEPAWHLQRDRTPNNPQIRGHQRVPLRPLTLFEGSAVPPVLLDVGNGDPRCGALREDLVQQRWGRRGGRIQCGVCVFVCT